MKKVLIFGLLLLTGCANVKNNPTVSSSDTCPVQKGTVVQVNDIEIVDGKPAQSAGIALGGYLGNKAGSNEVTRVVTTILGASVGAAVGSELDKVEAVELFIKLNNRENLISIPQVKSSNVFKQGDGIWVVGNVEPSRYNRKCGSIRILPVKGQ